MRGVQQASSHTKIRVPIRGMTFDERVFAALAAYRGTDHPFLLCVAFAKDDTTSRFCVDK